MRAQRAIFFHQMAEKKIGYKVMAISFYKSQNFVHQAWPKFHSCAKHCNLKYLVTKYAWAARKFFFPHIVEKILVTRWWPYLFRKARTLCIKHTPNFTAVISIAIWLIQLLNVRAQRANFFSSLHGRKKNSLQGDGHFFLEKSEFCAPSAPKILQLC